MPSAKDWLSKMKDAKVVCLGSWPGSVKRHIEFLEGLKNVEVGHVWLELPSPIHSYKSNTSSIRKPSTSRIVTPCNSRPMTYI